MPNSFRATLNYSSVNEDWRTEADALVPGPEDSVLSVTGSGARPLDLLALGPRRVLAVDLNPAQNALLHLKVAALRTLPFDVYARFLGLSAATRGERLEIFSRLVSDLPPGVSRFWNRNLRSVTSGVLWAGRWERYFRRVGFLAHLLRPRVTARLLGFEDIENQRRFVASQWDTPFGRLLTRVALSRPAVRFFFGDPAFRAFGGIPAGEFVHDRMTSHLGRVLASESFMVSLILTGRLPGADLPPHLTPGGAARIRGLLDRLEIVTADIVDILAARPVTERFDGFSLSDVPSFLPQPRFEELLDGIVLSATPSARFCIRLFLVRPTFPEAMAGRLIRDGALERRLAEDDHAFAYDFLAGSVSPG